MGDLLTPCPQCGAVPPAPRPPGECSRCLLLRALEPPPPEAFGDYQLLEQLGRGSMGVVYRARHRTLEREVALKLCEASGPRLDERLQRFRVEAQAATGLDHPAIVPVFEYGEYDGQPYYTMKLMGGGSLEDHLSSFTGAPGRAAALVAAIARAVHHGHDKAIIHRDLKPANILLDAGGRPYVADFGLAKRLDRSAELTRSGEVLGTPAYMSPEQAAGRDQGSIAADVYSLGAILYELITGRPPFDGATVLEVLRRIVDTEPTPPRACVPSLDKELQTICLRCLQKDPARRYGSAQALAEDLESYLRGDPIAASPISTAERLVRWGRRHPAAATLAAAAAIAPFLVATAALFIVSALRHEVLKGNAFAAHGIASAVLLQYERLGEQVAACAASPQVIELLASPALPTAEPQTAAAALVPFGAGELFDSISLFDRQGVAQFRWPAGRSEGRQFAWRDYFLGAQRLAQLRRRGVPAQPGPSAYVARPYLSEADDRFKFTLSAPVFNGAGEWLGVVSGSVRADSTLARLALPNDDRRTVAVVAARDRSRREAADGAPLPGEHMVLVHDTLRAGDAVAIDSPRLREVAALVARARTAEPNQFRLPPAGPSADEHHRDPISGFEGQWLAGLSPVGLTGHLVIVQSRSFGSSSGWGIGSLAASVVLLGLAALALGRSGRR